MSLGKQLMQNVFDRYLADGKLENENNEDSKNDGIDSEDYIEVSGNRRTSLTHHSKTSIRRLTKLTPESRQLKKENHSTDKHKFERVSASTKQNKRIKNQENVTRIVVPKEVHNSVDKQSDHLSVTEGVQNYTFQGLKPKYVISESQILKGSPLMKLKANSSCKIDVFEEACKQRIHILRSDPDDRIQRWIKLTDIYTGPDTDI